MIKKKGVLSVGKPKPTIHGGLNIMLKGLRDWHEKVNPSTDHRVKISPPLSRRERGLFPIAY